MRLGWIGNGNCLPWSGKPKRFECLEKLRAGKRGQAFLTVDTLMVSGIAGVFIERTRGEKLNFLENAEDRTETERRKAWESFIYNNRRRKIFVDREIDISHLCDEMNDMEKEFER